MSKFPAHQNSLVSSILITCTCIIKTKYGEIYINKRDLIILRPLGLLSVILYKKNQPRNLKLAFSLNTPNLSITHLTR